MKLRQREGALKALMILGNAKSQEGYCKGEESFTLLSSLSLRLFLPASPPTSSSTGQEGRLAWLAGWNGRAGCSAPSPSVPWEPAGNPLKVSLPPAWGGGVQWAVPP